MSTQTQDRKIKCPHCGWTRTVPASVLVDDSTTDVVRGIGEALKGVADKIKAALADTQLDVANAWVDMPACPNPNCRKVYRYNVRSGEVTP